VQLDSVKSARHLCMKPVYGGTQEEQGMCEILWLSSIPSPSVK